MSIGENNKIAHLRCVAFVVYASTGVPLSRLDSEARNIQRVLDPGFEVRLIPAATLEDVARDLRARRYRGRIDIFHFCGHANGKGLALTNDTNSDEFVFMKGLAPILKQPDAQQIVFLNGCNTEEQTKELQKHDFKAIIATSAGIQDDIASKFAAKFKALRKGSRFRKPLRMPKPRSELQESTPTSEASGPKVARKPPIRFGNPTELKKPGIGVLSPRPNLQTMSR